MSMLSLVLVLVSERIVDGFQRHRFLFFGCCCYWCCRKLKIDCEFGRKETNGRSFFFASKRITGHDVYSTVSIETHTIFIAYSLHTPLGWSFAVVQINGDFSFGVFACLRVCVRRWMCGLGSRRVQVCLYGSNDWLLKIECLLCVCVCRHYLIRYWRGKSKSYRPHPHPAKHKSHYQIFVLRSANVIRLIVWKKATRTSSILYICSTFMFKYTQSHGEVQRRSLVPDFMLVPHAFQEKARAHTHWHTHMCRNVYWKRLIALDDAAMDLPLMGVKIYIVYVDIVVLHAVCINTFI